MRVSSTESIELSPTAASSWKALFRSESSIRQPLSGASGVAGEESDYKGQQDSIACRAVEVGCNRLLEVGDSQLRLICRLAVSSCARILELPEPRDTNDAKYGTLCDAPT